MDNLVTFISLNLWSQQKELSSKTQRRRTLENQLETKQKNLEAVQNAAPDIQGQTQQIQQQIVRINQQRAQLAVEYKESVRVSTVELVWGPYQQNVSQVLFEHVYWLTDKGRGPEPTGKKDASANKLVSWNYLCCPRNNLNPKTNIFWFKISFQLWDLSHYPLPIIFDPP